MESLAIPRIAYAGEQIPIDLAINAPDSTQAAIGISAEGKLLGHNPVELTGGLNRLRVHARVKTEGATTISGLIHSDTYGEVQFEQAVELRRAKVLYLSQDPAGSEDNLLKAFNAASSK